MNVFSTAWTVARKDLRLYFRDRTGMVLGFLLPIVLITVFGVIMKYAFRGQGGMPQATLWVADEDDSPESRRLVKALRQSEMLRVRPSEDDAAETAEQVRNRVKDGDAHHGLIIELGYGAAVAAGELPKVSMPHDPGRAVEHKVISIGLVQAFMLSSEGRVWPAAMGKMMRDAGMEDAEAEAITGAARAMNRLLADFVEKETAENGPETESSEKTDRLAFEVDDIMTNMIPIEYEEIEPPGRPKHMTNMLARSVAGTTVMMLMFGMMSCSTMLLHEREGGTLQRLFVAAMPRSGVYWGKFLFTMIIGVIQLAVLFTYGNVVFQFGAFGDPVTLIVLSVTWAAAATSFAMLIAAWAHTAKQAEGLSTIMILVFSAVGGCWFPLQLMSLPPMIDLATRFSLAYWPMQGYHGLFWERWAWNENSTMLTAVAVQWGFAVVAAVAGLVVYRRRYVAG